MKATIIQFCIIFCTYSNYLLAQIGPPAYERILNNAPYIFEGIVLDTLYYDGETGTRNLTTSMSLRNPDGSLVKSLKPLTSHKIQITKIFRGAEYITYGTIDLIMEGGVYYFEESPLPNEGGWSEHGYRPMAIGSKGIFFCYKSEWKPSPMQTDNEMRVVPAEIVGFFLDGSDDLYGFGKTFYSKEEFYQFLLQYPNITIPREEGKKEDEE